MRPVPYLPNHQLTLLRGGAEFIPALTAAIAGARTEVLLETYIFALDQAGLAVQQALMDAAKRGVSVKLITDWHGTGQNNITDMNLGLLPSGVQHLNFNPWFKRGFSRTHRKLCVVDQSTAFIGGINLNDDWLCDFDPNFRLAAPRWDFAVQLQGPLVQDIWREVSAQWARLCGGRAAWRSFLARYRKRDKDQEGKAAEAPALAALVKRDNLNNRNTIQNAFQQAFGSAKKEILLATPYFAPGRKFINALCAAAQRGVRVTLLLGCGQFRLQDAVARSFYPQLLRAGVHLVEYRKTQLHAKVAVIDSRWASVGSSNFDGLSLFLNHEANLLAQDESFALTLRRAMLAGVADGASVTLASLDKQAWHQHLREYGAKLFYRGLMYILTSGKYG